MYGIDQEARRRYEEQSLRNAHLFEHVFPILRRDGFEGAPLCERLPSGRLRGQAIIAVPYQEGEVNVLVPFTMAGDGDLVPLASQSASRSGRASRWLKGGASVFEDDGGMFSPGPRPARALTPEAEVDFFFASILGADKSEPPREWLRYLPRFAEGCLRGMHEVEHVRRLRDIDDRELRAAAERLAESFQSGMDRGYAFSAGRVIRSSPKPCWIVAADAEGRVSVEIAWARGFDNPSDKTEAAFSLDREAEAMAFAQTLAGIVDGGKVRVRPGIAVYRPDLAPQVGFEETAISQGTRLGKLLEHVAPHLPAASIEPIRRLAAYCSGTARNAFDFGAWERVWTPVERAIGNPAEIATRVVGSAAERRSLIRFHQAFLVMQHLGGVVERPVIDMAEVRPFPANPVAAPVDLDVAGQAVAGMAELLRRAGEPFVTAWTEARDRIEDFRKWPDADAADALVPALRALAATVPEEFPSAPAAGRWAMRHRVSLRAELAGLAADRPDLGPQRR